jgi:hypothetical protein
MFRFLDHALSGGVPGLFWESALVSVLRKMGRRTNKHGCGFNCFQAQIELFLFAMKRLSRETQCMRSLLLSGSRNELTKEAEQTHVPR